MKIINMKKRVGYFVLMVFLLIIFWLAWSFFGDNKNEIDIEEIARQYCGEDRIVYVCEENIKVVNLVPGSGFTCYRSDGTKFSCPMVGPDSMSKECKSVSGAICDVICDSR